MNKITEMVKERHLQQITEEAKERHLQRITEEAKERHLQRITEEAKERHLQQITEEVKERHLQRIIMEVKELQPHLQQYNQIMVEMQERFLPIMDNKKIYKILKALKICENYNLSAFTFCYRKCNVKG